MDMAFSIMAKYVMVGPRVVDHVWLLISFSVLKISTRCLQRVGVLEASYKKNINKGGLGQYPPYTDPAKIDVGQIFRKPKNFLSPIEIFISFVSISLGSLDVWEVPKSNFFRNTM